MVHLNDDKDVKVTMSGNEFQTFMTHHVHVTMHSVCPRRVDGTVHCKDLKQVIIVLIVLIIIPGLMVAPAFL